MQVTERAVNSLIDKGKVCLVSLGCPKNLVDSEVMLGILKDHHFELTTDETRADVIVVNTCGFINDAKEESIDTILRLAELKEKGNCRLFIVAGCLSQRYKEELAEGLPEVDYFIGTGEYPKIAEIIKDGSSQRVIVNAPTYIPDHTVPRILSTPRHSAYVKVAEGCSNHCSYCTIPGIRGEFRSRPIQSILTEIENLVAQGVKEVNLIAQDTTSYGKDLNDPETLEDLLEEMVKIDGLKWIRLLYLYPNRMTDGLIRLIRDNEKICKYIDIPTQHISDRILKTMNRRYRRQDIERLIQRVREEIPGVVLRTSLIVGFPGETERDFEELLDFVKGIRFDRLGAFKYSREEGTPAYEMDKQVTENIKRSRFKQIMKTQARISLEKNKAMVGSTVKVLVEGASEESDLLLKGRIESQAPDIDGVTYINK
ncbi:MAG: 30S ribosomal protein S12 methylthiotransferase RimO, partial [Deltaproteobacteria bacterium]|nr:30S ribosomal protein S12 methylthiotransferase RimO [Deltaproteobacteria bacterium]